MIRLVFLLLFVYDAFALAIAGAWAGLGWALLLVGLAAPRASKMEPNVAVAYRGVALVVLALLGLVALARAILG